MFPCFSLLNAAAVCFAAAHQHWLNVVVGTLGLGACLFFALAVERMEDR
jgi:hypothetical protein